MDIPAVSNVQDLAGDFIDSSLLLPFEQEGAVQVALDIVAQVKDLLSDTSKTERVLDELFHPEAFWRDHVSLSWSLRTFHPTSTIAHNVVAFLERAAIPRDSIQLQQEQVLAIGLPNGVPVVRVPFVFHTTSPEADCTAALKLIRLANGDVKVFTITTALTALDAAPWQDVLKTRIPDRLPEELDVLVVGGGHGGLVVSGYLKALGLKFAMVDREAEIGDAWAKRYDSVTLHTTRVFSGLPFMPFPMDYPEYIPAKLVAEYYKSYVTNLGIPAFPGRECVSATFNNDAWLVKCSTGETTKAKLLVFAIGVGGRWPSIPNIPGQDLFKGEQLHSIEYKDASRFSGKRVAVIGSATTACDVSFDCCRAGADVTIVQRGPTRIYPQKHITTMLTTFWNDSQPVEVGDVMASEDPIVLQAILSSTLLGMLNEVHNPEYYAGLDRAGFRYTKDGAVHQQIYCRGGGHYPDVGAVAAISNGDIKVRHDLQAITETGLELADGGRLEVDAIVYATGFDKDVRKYIARIIGDEHKLRPVWGLDAEGEVRGVWRPTGHDKLWYQGGELQTMRYYGTFLALQVAAEVKGIRPKLS